MEARLNRLVGHAAILLRAPHAQVTLVGDAEQVVAAAHGLVLSDASRRGPAADSLCTVAVASGRTLVVTDAAQDPLVAHLPPVISGAVGGYLGALLTDPDGLVLGALCVFDPARRDWTSEDVALLEEVALLARAELVELVEHVVALPSDLGLRATLAAAAAELGSFVLSFADGGRLDADERMLALHGHSAETFDGSPAAFKAVTHPADLPSVLKALEQARTGLGELAIEYRVVLPDGQHRWVRVRGRVMPDLLGRPSHLLGAAYDASAERGLRDELVRLMETMPVGLVRLDREWRFTYVNVVAEQIYQRTREELVGVGLHQAFPEARDTDFFRAFVTAMRSGAPGSVEAYFPPLDRHFEVRIWPDEQGLTLFFHDVTERLQAQRALQRASERLRLLAEAGAQLSGSLQPAEVLEVLGGLLVPALACSVTVAVIGPVAELLCRPLANDPDLLHLVHVQHVDPATEAELRAVLAALDLRTTADSGIGRAVRTRQAQLMERVPDVLMRDRAVDDAHYEQMQRLNTGPQLTVPLDGASGVLGALTVAGSEDQPLDDVLLRDLTARASVALENALSFARQHQAANVLQRALLPRTPPAARGVLVATRYLPAAAHALAGGDFFKTVLVDGTLVCAIGDVMGHGTASAARAGQLHGLVAALALQGCGPGELLGQLSRGVEQMMDLELATLLVCAYDPATRRLTAATAGHPPPLVAPLSGAPSYVDLVPGPPIGVAEDDYAERTVELTDGGTVVLFSDGLVERRGESLTVGLERLRQAVAELRMPPEAVADHVLDALGARHGGDDDIALLVLSQP